MQFAARDFDTSEHHGALTPELHGTLLRGELTSWEGRSELQDMQKLQKKSYGLSALRQREAFHGLGPGVSQCELQDGQNL